MLLNVKVVKLAQSPLFFGLTFHSLKPGCPMPIYDCRILKINENPNLTLYLISLVRRTMRCSTAKAFLRSARNRKNLDIITEAQVLKVLVDKVAKRAYGVKYLRNGKVNKVIAGREVILSAGALNSPQLLMLSGIGRS